MPTLRFSRDRRGYESTYLLHASRRRPGAEQAQLLYWFRSPPHVKIGRAAFDEDAIRLLEEQHPDVEFDWDRILTTKPPAAPEVRDPRDSRAGRRPERRPAKEARRDAPRPWQPATPPLEMSSQAEQATPEATGPASVIDEPAAAKKTAPVLQDAPTPPAPLTVVPVPGPPPRRFVRVFDAPAPAAALTEHHASEPSAVERLLGAEQLTVLRARHAEILARISVRGGDPARLEALREQASAVDPDGWVTEADVTAGLASIDDTLAELHRIVGRRRRRRRRRRGDTGQVPAAGATTANATGASLDVADADEERGAGDVADGPDDE